MHLHKTGYNTPYVVEALVTFASIPTRAVSYDGLQDCHDVTKQWFCPHLPGSKSNPDFAAFQLACWDILATARARRKLRIGTLKGNAFTLILREISDQEEIESWLNRILYH